MSKSDDDLGLDAEQHPDTGKWRWIWSNAAGAQRFGLFKFGTEKECRTAGRIFIAEHEQQAQAITDGDE